MPVNPVENRSGHFSGTYPSDVAGRAINDLFMTVFMVYASRDLLTSIIAGNKCNGRSRIIFWTGIVRVLKGKRIEVRPTKA